MALNDFFRINLPCGLRKNSDSEWFVFNREYMPLGWNNVKGQQSIHSGKAYSDLPLYTKYKGITDAFLVSITEDPSMIQRDEESGEIHTVFLYKDATNPKSQPKYWNQYFDKIKALANLERA